MRSRSTPSRPSATVELYDRHARRRSRSTSLPATRTGSPACGSPATAARRSSQRPFASRVTVATRRRRDGLRHLRIDRDPRRRPRPGGNANRRTIYADIYAEIRFDIPLPAVTGRSFTIAPSMPRRFRGQPGRFVHVFAGDGARDKALDAATIFDDSFGAIEFQRAPTNGKCSRGRSPCPGCPFRSSRAGSRSTRTRAASSSPPGRPSPVHRPWSSRPSG